MHFVNFSTMDKPSQTLFFVSRQFVSLNLSIRPSLLLFQQACYGRAMYLFVKLWGKRGTQLPNLTLQFLQYLGRQGGYQKENSYNVKVLSIQQVLPTSTSLFGQSSMTQKVGNLGVTLVWSTRELQIVLNFLQKTLRDGSVVLVVHTYIHILKCSLTKVAQNTAVK